ncbi:DUF1573 domain-containing protein [Candidatus Kaiserbacteria bacterium]|nr:DUF1573 domain-containing protein [Candidatus Kaiserbacteria bacterium]
MNKYVIGIAALAILLIFSSYVLPNSGGGNTAEVASAVSVIESSYDFGDIDIFDGKVSTTYTLRNDGDEDVRILSAVTSCMCTEGKIGDLEFGMHESSKDTVVIPVGGEETLSATFDPLAHGPNGTGKIKRELFLKTNSTATPEIKVTFSANVVKNETE